MEKLFNKILVANRGEIAVRVIRTLKKMQIKSVAVYSEADKDSLHVKMADQAFLIGGPRVNESYLKIEKIIEVAKTAGVDAIHPGYGLLSENPLFAKRCQDEGIVFIGPKADVIKKMGSKIEARKIMESIGVPIIPGNSQPLTDVNKAITAADDLGYPVMLKASAGGGGIGMQIIRDKNELMTAFEGNQKRAKDFFGDGSMFLEKYIENPRHIEIQILADNYRNTVFLWERECSIQRRHQKVIEEAPSPFLDEATRIKMGETAVKAVSHINYSNAGTIEFIVDQDKNFYFLEMNTRLQVEHPVTEEITGFDLVEYQIRIAADEELNFSQDDVKRDGHAIEARIYAEDPDTFFPSPGKITKLEMPTGEFIRHELSIIDGTVITPFYDPMIAKLIVKGKNRQDAVEKINMALNEYKIEGIKTNIPMLLKVFSNEEFKNGNTTTNFIGKYLTK